MLFGLSCILVFCNAEVVLCKNSSGARTITQIRNQSYLFVSNPQHLLVETLHKVLDICYAYDIHLQPLLFYEKFDLFCLIEFLIDSDYEFYQL